MMAEFVRFTLDNGSEVLFESAESDLVAQHGGAPEVRDGGKLTARLQGVAEAAQEVAESLRSRLVSDEVSLEFGLQLSGGMNWFFAQAQTQGTIKVTVKWAGNSASAAPLGIGQGLEDRQAMHHAALHMGYLPTVRIAKTRRTATLDDTLLCIDEVDGVGEFLELERLAPDHADAQAIQADLAAVVSSLGITATRTDETYASLVHAAQE
jgi:hypothetical protein